MPQNKNDLTPYDELNSFQKAFERANGIAFTGLALTTLAASVFLSPVSKKASHFFERKFNTMVLD